MQERSSTHKSNTFYFITIYLSERLLLLFRITALLFSTATLLHSFLSTPAQITLSTQLSSQPLNPCNILSFTDPPTSNISTHQLPNIVLAEYCFKLLQIEPFSHLPIPNKPALHDTSKTIVRVLSNYH
jgi:hypothetical protein